MGDQTIPKEKTCKKTKWLSKEALQIAKEKRETKVKGQRERYAQMNAEFPGIAKNDEKAFLNKQCKQKQ